VIKVRRATDGDSDAILKLTVGFATTFEIDESKWRASFARILPDEEALLLVAEEDGVVEGYLLAFVHETLHANAPVAWVDELAVDPSSQRRGTGRLLMEAAEEWARERGCAMVSLATRRAGDFYGAIGYEESAMYYRRLL
jgi:GNAT superfamily N-acetyltransferase